MNYTNKEYGCIKTILNSQFTCSGWGIDLAVIPFKTVLCNVYMPVSDEEQNRILKYTLYTAMQTKLLSYVKKKRRFSVC